MNTKHTPGPWKQGKTSPENVSANSALVCRTFSRGKWNGEQEANARLIAAAPELLESLEEVLAYCSEHGHDWMCMAHARAIITKATGEVA